MAGLRTCPQFKALINCIKAPSNSSIFFNSYLVFKKKKKKKKKKRKKKKKNGEFVKAKIYGWLLKSSVFFSSNFLPLATLDIRELKEKGCKNHCVEKSGTFSIVRQIRHDYLALYPCVYYTYFVSFLGTGTGKPKG